MSRLFRIINSADPELKLNCAGNHSAHDRADQGLRSPVGFAAAADRYNLTIACHAHLPTTTSTLPQMHSEVVGRLRGYLLRHDDPVLGIDSRLYVVCWRDPVPDAH